MTLFSINTAITQEQYSTLTFHDNFEDDGAIALEKVLIQLVLTFTTTPLLLENRGYKFS